MASLTRQSFYQCVALSTADGVFGVRDESAYINSMRLAIEKAISSGMYIGRTCSE